MYKMIIVDDESFAIDGLKKFIDWKSLEIDVVATALNGVDGLDKIRTHKPDIIVTDIKMPMMGGIQMLKTLKEENLNPKVVVFSGYGEFEYAKESIRYGVIDYILKPSLPVEIYNTMKKVVSICEEERKSRALEAKINEAYKRDSSALTEKFIEELFEGTILSEVDYNEKSKLLDFRLEYKNIRIVTIQIDLYHVFLKMFNETERQSIKDSLLNLAASSFNINNSLTLFKGRDLSLLLVNIPGNTPQEQAQFIKDKSMKLVNEFHTMGISISIGVGLPVNNVLDIKDSYSQAIECLKYKLQLGFGNIIFFEDIMNVKFNVPSYKLFNRDELIDGIKLRNRGMLDTFTTNVITNIKKNKYLKYDIIRTKLIEIIGITSMTIYQIGEKDSISFDAAFSFENIQAMESIEEIDAWLKAFFDTVFDEFIAKNNQKTNRILEQILEYIKTEYNNDISLEELSKKIYITPNYLSNIFSQNMGENFTKYLNRYRIEKAKLLIKENKHKLYDICEMVGYKNVDYFRKIFKEYTGVKPSNF